MDDGARKEQLTYWRAQSLDRRVHFVAAPFGLGPRAAAENLAHALNLPIGRWHRSDQANMSEGRASITLNFGVANIESVSTDTSLTVWIDCLLWLLPREPSILSQHGIILAEQFFQPPRNLLSAERVSGIHPLIRRIARRQANESGPIVLSFGGVETPYTSDVQRLEMPHMLIEVIAHAQKQLKDYRKLICFLPRSLLSRFRESLPFPNLDLRPLSRLGFFNVLPHASRFVVQPGLYSPFEAFGAAIPTSLCFPMSYTQAQQMQKFHEEGLLPTLPLPEDLLRGLLTPRTNLEGSEAKWFELSEEWWKRHICTREFREAMNLWAMGIVTGQHEAEGLLEARRQYVEGWRTLPSAERVLYPIFQHLDNELHLRQLRK